jgi:hypothetical protein
VLLKNPNANVKMYIDTSFAFNSFLFPEQGLLWNCADGRRVRQNRIPQPLTIKQEPSNDVSLTSVRQIWLFYVLVVTVRGLEPVSCEGPFVTLFPNLFYSVEAVGTFQSAW